MLPHRYVMRIENAKEEKERIVFTGTLVHEKEKEVPSLPAKHVSFSNALLFVDGNSMGHSSGF